MRKFFPIMMIVILAALVVPASAQLGGFGEMPTIPKPGMWVPRIPEVELSSTTLVPYVPPTLTINECETPKQFHGGELAVLKGDANTVYGIFSDKGLNTVAYYWPGGTQVIVDSHVWCFDGIRRHKIYHAETNQQGFIRASNLAPVNP